MNDDSSAVENNETNINNDPFEWNYYTFYRTPVLINKKIISNDGLMCKVLLSGYTLNVYYG